MQAEIIHIRPTIKPEYSSQQYDWKKVMQERNEAIAKRRWASFTFNPLAVTIIGLLAGFGTLEVILIAVGHL